MRGMVVLQLSLERRYFSELLRFKTQSSTELPLAFRMYFWKVNSSCLINQDNYVLSRENEY